MKLKRKMMCFVALALVVLLTMSAATPESTSTVAEEFSSFDVFASEFGEEFAINYFRTLELLDSLYDSLPQDRMGRTLYPNNFGGQYINDTGELVILVVQGSLASETEHNFMHSLSTDRVIIREVEFAYNCLRSALGLLRTAISNSYDCVAALNVDTIAFNVRHNEVRVYLAKYTEYHIDVFKNAILDAPFLVFNQSPGIASLDYSSVELMTPAYDNTTMRVQPRPALVRPGDGIYLRNPSGRFVASGSVGYRASMSVPGLGHMNGFVTAAHLGPIAFGRTLRPNDRIYNSNEVHIGTVRVVQLEGIDTAFFSVETDIIDSSNTWFGNVLGTIADVRASAGHVVFIDGRHGRGRAGVVQEEVDTHMTIAGVRFRVEGVLTNHTTLQGNDSGGIAYSWTHPANNGVVGTVVGSTASGGALITRASLHAITLGLFPR